MSWFSRKELTQEQQEALTLAYEIDPVSTILYLKGCSNNYLLKQAGVPTSGNRKIIRNLQQL